MQRNIFDMDDDRTISIELKRKKAHRLTHFRASLWVHILTDLNYNSVDFMLDAIYNSCESRARSQWLTAGVSPPISQVRDVNEAEGVPLCFFAPWDQ